MQRNFGFLRLSSQLCPIAEDRWRRGVPPAEAGSGERRGLSARVNSCPDTKRIQSKRQGANPVEETGSKSSRRGGSKSSRRETRRIQSKGQGAKSSRRETRQIHSKRQGTNPGEEKRSKPSRREGRARTLARRSALPPRGLGGSVRVPVLGIKAHFSGELT